MIGTIAFHLGPEVQMESVKRATIKRSRTNSSRGAAEKRTGTVFSRFLRSPAPRSAAGSSCLQKAMRFPASRALAGAGRLGRALRGAQGRACQSRHVVAGVLGPRERSHSAVARGDLPSGPRRHCHEQSQSASGAVQRGVYWDPRQSLRAADETASLFWRGARRHQSKPEAISGPIVSTSRPRSVPRI